MIENPIGCHHKSRTYCPLSCARSKILTSGSDETGTGPSAKLR